MHGRLPEWGELRMDWGQMRSLESSNSRKTVSQARTGVPCPKFLSQFQVCSVMFFRKIYLLKPGQLQEYHLSLLKHTLHQILKRIFNIQNVCSQGRLFFCSHACSRRGTFCHSVSSGPSPMQHTDGA